MLASSEEFAENTENGQKPRLKFCRFFATKQGCRNGSNCKFLHQKQDELKSEEKIKSPGLKPVEHISEDSTAVNKKSTTEVSKSEETTTVTDISDKPAQNEVCKFYARTKRCWYGDRCKFQHVYGGTRNKRKSQTDQPGKPKDTPKAAPTKSAALDDSKPEGEDGVHPEVNDDTTKNVESKSKKKKPRPKPVCRYWKAGHCRLADRCRYRHPGATNTESETGNVQDDGPVDASSGKTGEQEVATEGMQGESGKVPVKKPVPIKPELLLDQLDDEAIAKLRNTEVEQLKRRFPKALVGRDYDDGCDFHVLQFSSSDPDWPYDVKEVTLQVKFPEGYPKEMMSIIMPADQPLPDPLRRCIMFGIRDWVKNKHTNLAADGKTQLVFRPMLRWLDKNLEDLFTEGLKQFQRELMAQAAGLEFIPASHLQEALPGSQMSDSDKAEDENVELTREPTNEDDKENINMDNQYESDEEERPVKADHDVSSYKEPAKKGTEVKLHNLQLREGASTMRCLKVKVIIQCNRCKGQTEIHTPAEVLNSVACGRCNSEQLVAWRPALVHQFNSVIGYLDLQGCVVFDLVFPDCQFMLGCLNCSKEMKLEGLAVGQVKDTWCLHCHQKMRVAAETVKFQQLQPNLDLENQKAQVVVQRSKKVAKDPAIQEGKPLPSEGTCKHYKKSYRWFRFPCCGKTYPCDLCHEDKEDHDMIFANRTICGFCCKEQPYAPDKPCVLCQSSMTKKTSTHWEGGSGCRDKIKMAKGDKQKYSGSTKTTSKKTQLKNENKGKKVTKLRHT